MDATTVRSHCNPNRKRVSDPEASWTAKNSARAKAGGKEWHHGYKVHMVADANYGLPLGPSCHDCEAKRLAGAAGGDSPGRKPCTHGSSPPP